MSTIPTTPSNQGKQSKKKDGVNNPVWNHGVNKLKNRIKKTCKFIFGSDPQLVIATYILGAATIALAIYALDTANLTRVALRKADTTAWKQDTATARQLRSFEDQKQRQLRAYISVSYVNDSTEGILGFLLQFIIKNTGQTPARNMNVSLHHFVARYSNDKKFTIPITADSDRVTIVLNPGQTANFGIDLDSLTPKELFLLRAEKMDNRLYVFGEVTYLDVFNKSDTTRFAYLADYRKRRIWSCKYGNDIER